MMLVIDMAQNGATPFLSGDQMGDFYYMSPIIHNIFGVACPAKDFMNTYIGIGLFAIRVGVMAFKRGAH